MKKSPTIRDIAAKAGVSRTTVSDALRGRATVAPKTKERILKVAEEMGYHQDARVGELMTYLRNRKSRQDVVPLAWVYAQPQKKFKQMSVWREMFEGAQGRATELGYSLEPFSLNPAGMKTQRLTKVLYSRGISGLILSPPFDAPEWKQADWSPFTCIQVSVDPLDHSYPSVTPDRRFAIQEIWTHLKEQGYQRIALALKASADHRVDDAFASQYIWLSSSTADQPAIPVLTFSEAEVKEPSCRKLNLWLKDHRPDVIITNFGDLAILLPQQGVSVPEQMGIALTNVDEDNEYFSGVSQLNRAIGSNAVDLLTMQLNYRKGEHTRFLSSVRIKGVWKPGKTTVNLKTHDG